MRKFALTLFYTIVSLSLFGQVKPDWLDSDIRNVRYPKSAFLTGYAESNIETGETPGKAVERAKTIAQTALLENIRVTMSSNTRYEAGSMSSNRGYDEYEAFVSKTEKTTDAEITGMNIESYHNQKNNTVYAFAYVSKAQLTGYYQNQISLWLNKMEGTLQTAQNLEESREKAKARQQLEAVKPIFEKIHYAQDLLTVVNLNVSAEELQQTKTKSLYNQLIQMQARLAQAVYVYVESEEDLFGRKVNIVGNKLKAELAKNGCSFTDNTEDADFRLKINVYVRDSSNQEGVFYCYADTQVELYDTHKQKVVYSDEIAQKGGSVSREKAGRKAMDDVVSKISGKLKGLF